MKIKIFTGIGAICGFVTTLLGGWDAALATLLLFMLMDWVTGGILLPAIFKKSPKSKNGALESRAGWKGLCRNGYYSHYHPTRNHTGYQSTHIWYFD